MPAITSGTVLVTGINGFAAMWVAQYLFQNGFSVRGTVRAPAKATHVQQFFKSYANKLDIVVVDDITKVRISALPPELTERRT